MLSRQHDRYEYRLYRPNLVAVSRKYYLANVFTKQTKVGLQLQAMQNLRNFGWLQVSVILQEFDANRLLEFISYAVFSALRTWVFHATFHGSAYRQPNSALASPFSAFERRISV